MEDLRREEVELAARRALGDGTLTLVDYTVEPASSQAIGFMGTHLRLVVRVRRPNSDHAATTEPLVCVHLFAKAPPSSHFHRDYVAICRFFSRECRMFVSYGPRLSEALERRGLSLPLPRCHVARGEDNGGDLVIMEDLTSRGFRMADKRRPMDLPECRAVLGALARLHGASALLQLKDQGLRQEWEGIKEPLFFDEANHPSSLCNRSSAETFTTAVSLLWPEKFGGQEGRKRVLDAAWRSWLDVYRVVGKSEKYLNVLCHGDTWPNNIMLCHPGVSNSGEQQPSESPGDPEVVLVDFQLHRYTPPAADIVFFLHSSTRRALRDQHWENLLGYYREAFVRAVTAEVADNILPWVQLVQSTQDLRVFGRHLAGSTLLSVVLPRGGEDELKGEGEKEEDFVQEMLRDRGRELVAQMEEDPCLKERLTEAYVEYLESIGLWE